MTLSIEEAYETLIEWCRNRDYSGYDPFDGLNSRVFQLSPLKYSRTARLAWLQLFKRSPVNLRALTAVPVGKNPKGLALFALAHFSRYRSLGIVKYREEGERLLAELMAMRASSRNGTAWGYNFDWQNRAFLAQRGTPTIVPTAFAARAFIEAAGVLGDNRYLKIASDTCSFITGDLNVTDESADEICWSYSPLDQTRVFNASLLAAETLASVGAATANDRFKALAVRGARYVMRRQRPDGSWAYGAEGFQSWSDNFHTAFILTSLSRILDDCGPDSLEGLEGTLQRGYQFWTTRFFGEDGLPMYYPGRLYPADAHSAGAALAAFSELNRLNEDSLSRADSVAAWALGNLRDPTGFFYYQRRASHTVRTPYMRWSQAWMAYGLARLLEARGGRGSGSG
jgi:hypothetical protein